MRALIVLDQCVIGERGAYSPPISELTPQRETRLEVGDRRRLPFPQDCRTMQCTSKHRYRNFGSTGGCQTTVQPATTFCAMTTEIPEGGECSCQPKPVDEFVLFFAPGQCGPHVVVLIRHRIEDRQLHRGDPGRFP